MRQAYLFRRNQRRNTVGHTSVLLNASSRSRPGSARETGCTSNYYCRRIHLKVDTHWINHFTINDPCGTTAFQPPAAFFLSSVSNTSQNRSAGLSYGYVSLCPRLFVPTSLYAPKSGILCPRLYMPPKVVFCAHVSLCPRPFMPQKWYFVPTSLCAHVSICPNVCKWEFRVGILYVNSQTYQWSSNGQTDQWSVVKLTSGQAVVKLTPGKAVGKVTSGQAVFKLPMWSINVKNDQWSSSSQTDQCQAVVKVTTDQAMGTLPSGQGMAKLTSGQAII